MSEQNQLFLKLFVLYFILLAVLSTVINYAFGNPMDWKRDVLLFLLIALGFSFYRSRRLGAKK